MEVDSSAGFSVPAVVKSICAFAGCDKSATMLEADQELCVSSACTPETLGRYERRVN